MMSIFEYLYLTIGIYSPPGAKRGRPAQIPSALPARMQIGWLLLGWRDRPLT